MAYLDDLLTRRAAIASELAALSSSAAGGKPNASGSGVNVDHVGYKDGLYRELAEIDAAIIRAKEVSAAENAGAAGPFEYDITGWAE